MERCEEGGVGRAQEGTAACVVVGGLEDAAVASDLAVHRVDHQRESGGSQEGHQGVDLEVHQLDCLRETHTFRTTGNYQHNTSWPDKKRERIIKKKETIIQK